jgi:glycosyltransferase involved in cell wall biosynthesis
MSAPNLSCGVALCTCNGARYLTQQLDSITNQSHRPGSIAVFDDRSDDATWTMLQSWAATCDIPIQLHQNSVRVGVVKNFEMAIAALDTDLVFLCDQDDVWFADKVERLQAVFAADDAVMMVHTDARLVDSATVDMGQTLFGALGLTDTERNGIRQMRGFDILTRRNVITGATAAIRRTLYDIAKPFPPQGYHDEWMAIVAAAIGKIVLLDEPTIHYRQHDKNVVGVKKATIYQVTRQFWWQINRTNPREGIVHRLGFRKALADKLRSDPRAAPGTASLAEEGWTFANFRAYLPDGFMTRTGPVVMGFISGKYRRFSFTPWYDVFRDLLNR